MLVMLSNNLLIAPVTPVTSHDVDSERKYIQYHDSKKSVKNSNTYIFNVNSLIFNSKVIQITDLLIMYTVAYAITCTQN